MFTLGGLNPARDGRRTWLIVALLALGLAASSARGDDSGGRIKALFLGDRGHHTPLPRAAELTPPLAKSGIDVAYTDDLADLNSENLAAIRLSDHLRES